jgi:hypothetical protein
MKSQTAAAATKTHPACRVATLGSAGELRSPKPAESRLRAKLPALQGVPSVFITLRGPEAHHPGYFPRCGAALGAGALRAGALRAGALEPPPCGAALCAGWLA